MGEDPTENLTPAGRRAPPLKGKDNSLLIFSVSEECFHSGTHWRH